MKKGIIFRYLLSSACTLSLIGTGFALWFFNGSRDNITKTVQLNANVTAVADIGDLSLTLPSGYSAFHLILGQANTKYSVNGTGIGFTPSININYSNYQIDNRINTFLVAKIIFNNNVLEDHIEAENIIREEYKGTEKAYVVLEEKLTLSDKEYISSYTPSFGYKLNKAPKSSVELTTMIDNLTKFKVESALGYDLTIVLSIETRF